MTKLIELSQKNEISMEEVDIMTEIFIADEIVSHDIENEVWKYEIEEGSDFPNFGSLRYYLKTIGSTEDQGRDAIQLYINSHPQHFNEEGQWEARYLLDGVEYICRKLVDEKIVGEDKLNKYKKAFRYSKSWVENVMRYAVHSLSEDLIELEALKSDALKYKLNKIKELKDINSGNHAGASKIVKSHEKISEELKKADINQDKIIDKLAENAERIKELEEIIEKRYKAAVEDIDWELKYPAEAGLYSEYEDKLRRIYLEKSKTLVDSQMTLPFMKTG